MTYCKSVAGITLPTPIDWRVGWKWNIKRGTPQVYFSLLFGWSKCFGIPEDLIMWWGNKPHQPRIKKFLRWMVSMAASFFSPLSPVWRTDVQKRLSNLPRHNYRTTLQWADPWTLMPPPVSQHPSTEPRCLTSQVADQFNRPEYTRGYFKQSQLIPPNIKRVMLEYTP